MPEKYTKGREINDGLGWCTIGLVGRLKHCPVKHSLPFISHSRFASKNLPCYVRVKVIEPVTVTSVDFLVIEYLRAGMVDWEKHSQFLDQEEGDILRDEVTVTYNSMFDLAFNNFQASSDKVRISITGFITAHLRELKLPQLYQLKLLLAHVGPTKDIDEHVDAMIDEFAIANADSDLTDLHMSGINSELAAKIRQKWESIPVRKPIDEGITLVTRSDSWNTRDLRFLKQYTTSDYLDWLETDSSNNLFYRIKTFRERFQNDVLGQSIIAQLDPALLKMAERSNLDKKRVFGAAGLPEPPKDVTEPTNENPQSRLKEGS